MKSRWLLIVAVQVFAVTFLVTTNARQLGDTFTNWLDHPAINYHSTSAKDPVADLNRRLTAGDARLEFEGASGYLRSVLAALDVPVESQIAVFVQDSAQRALISMSNPRTLFFNDSVSVGWVRGGFIELAALDPTQGVIFYVLDQARTGQPRFTRRDACLSCHHSFATAGVPGMLVRSASEFAVNHTVPLDRRWGGWYVTGRQVPVRHRGNLDLEQLFATPAPSAPKWASFDSRFDTSGYLSTHSDIVALMVFEHQMHLINLFSRVGWETRVADFRVRQRQDDQGPALVPVDEAAKEIVDYMLFVNEAPFAEAIEGSSGFVERFEARGPRDRGGRSLRQLDLRRRLMRYPCSYMIYTPVFDELPGRAKDAVFRRLWEVLSGDVADPSYAVLSLTDRQAIVEILRETKPGLPAYFQSVTH